MKAEVLFQVRTYFNSYVNVTLSEFNFVRKLAKKGTYVIDVDKSCKYLWFVQLCPKF